MRIVAPIPIFVINYAKKKYTNLNSHVSHVKCCVSPIFCLANISDTLFHHMSPVHQEAWLPAGDKTQHTDFVTYILNQPRGQYSQSLKTPVFGKEEQFDYNCHLSK